MRGIRNFFRRNTGTIVAAVMGAGLASGAFVMASPPEDSPRFNCAQHGNRMCGVTVDVKPNARGGVKRYVLDFKVNPKGDAVAVVRPFGPKTK